MKRILALLALVVLAPLSSWAQGNAVVLSFPGAPTGSCAAFIMMAVNASNGDFYSCASNAWVKVTGTQTGAVNAVYGSTGTITTLANPVFTGTLSAAAGTFSTTLGVTGAATLSSTLAVSGATTLAAMTATTGSFSGNLTTNVTGSTQCLHVNSSGVISGAGSDCGTTNLAFSAITAGTNTTAAMLVGAGGSLQPTSTGHVTGDSLFALTAGGATVPSGTIHTTAPVGTNANNPSGWVQLSDGTWNQLYGIDTFCDNTTGLTCPAGAFTFYSPIAYNDTLTSPISGKNASFAMYHKAGVGASSGNQDRSLHIQMGNINTGDTASYYGWEGIQVQMTIVGTPTFTGSPDAEVSAGSFQTTDNRTSTIARPNQYGVNGVRAHVSRNSTGNLSACGVFCYFGLYALAQNNAAGDGGGNGMFAIRADVVNGSGTVTNLKGYGVGIFPPTVRFPTSTIGLNIGTFGSNSADYNIVSGSAGTAGDGKNWFQGPIIGDLYQDMKEVAAPANPASGYDRLYLDSTTHVLTCLTSAGASCLGSGSGSVTSVAATVPSGIAVSGSPITSSGTLAFTWSVAGADSVILSSAANTADFAALTDCHASSSAVTYNTSTHAFGCNTISGSGTVNGGTAGQLGYYATSSSAISGNANATISTGALTLGQSGTAGSLILNGATSGTATISASATGGTLILPASELSTITGSTQCLHVNSSGIISGTGSDCGGGGGSSALSSITAAIGSNTIANGDNPQVWNWATTTSGQIGMTFGETTASASAGSPYGVRITTLIGSTATPLKVDNSLNGSQTLPTLSILPTWNTSGVVDAALLVNPTNTSSGAASLLADFQLGGTSQWKVDKAGITTQLGAGNFPVGSAGSPAVAISSSGGLSGDGSGNLQIGTGNSTFKFFLSSTQRGTLSYSSPNFVLSAVTTNNGVTADRKSVV